MRDKVVFKPKQSLGQTVLKTQKTQDVEDTTKTVGETKKKTEAQINLKRAVQALMDHELPSFYFLAGFANLMMCDGSGDGVWMFY